MTTADLPALAVAYREYKIRLTNPIFPLWDVVVPVVYLLIFGSSVERWLGGGLEGVHYPTFFLAGVLAMVTFSIAMNSSYSFFEDLQSGIFYELLTYPFPRRDLLLGKLAFNVLFSVVGALLCVLAGVLVLGIPVPPGALPALTLWIVVGTSAWYLLFAFVSLKVRRFNAYHTTTSTMFLLLMFVSNLFYPTDGLPRALQWMAWLNPITWQVDLMRYHTYGADPAPLWGLAGATILQGEAVAFALFTLLCYWLANRVLNGPME